MMWGQRLRAHMVYQYRCANGHGDNQQQGLVTMYSFVLSFVFTIVYNNLSLGKSKMAPSKMQAHA
jgi:hypothetical protein